MTINVISAEIDVFQADSSNSDNLANHWPMNETRGTTGNDVQGSADLTLKSGITVDSGTYDGLPTYDFDGSSNSYAAITTKKFDSSGSIGEITVAALVRPDDDGRQKSIISFDRDEYFELSIMPSGVVRWTTVDSTGTQDALESSTDVVSDGNIHLVAGTYNRNTTPEKRIHVDGSTDVSNSPHGGNALGTGTTRFGFIGEESEASSEDGTVDGFQYGGEMALCFLYDKALTESNLSGIHGAGAVAFAPNFTIPSSDIKQLDASQRIDKRRDTGRIRIENNDGTYDSDSNEIDPGDLLRFRTQLQGESSLTHQWSAMAETILYEERGPNRADLRIEATDFVFGIISNRIIENSYEGNGVFDIVDDVMSGKAPEIHTDRVQNITETADAFPRGSNVLDFLNELAGKADAVISNRDRSLVFEKAQEAPFAFNLDSSDRTPPIIRLEGETIANNIRVDGGENAAIDDQQTTQSSTTTVTDSTRITHQISSRKSEVQFIDLYTSKTGSGDGVNIRLQKDDGGSPVAVNDADSDITSKLKPAEDLTDGGLTTFRMPRDHNLIDPNPWMIIESDGSSGQDIGVDGSGNPRYDAYFRILLSTVALDIDSQTEFRERERRIYRENVRSRDAATELARSEIRHSKEPDTFIDFTAESTRAHNLNVGEIIGVSETNASGDFIVTEKTTQYSGLKLQTDIDAQKVSTV